MTHSDDREEPVAAQTLPPRLDFTRPTDLLPADARQLRAHDQREGESFGPAGGVADDLSGATFIECEFTSITFSETRLRGARFRETLLTAPFATVLAGAGTKWTDVLVESPRWGSAELYDAQLTRVHISGGKIDYLNLRGAVLVDVLFEGVAITDLDLAGARVTRVALKDCVVGTLDLSAAACTDVDLRGTEFSIINGIPGLAGTTVDDDQLAQLGPVLAHHLGIKFT